MLNLLRKWHWIHSWGPWCKPFQDLYKYVWSVHTCQVCGTIKLKRLSETLAYAPEDET